MATTEPIPYFSLVVLCYRAEESIIPFVEGTHKLLSQYSFNWEMVLVANYLPGVADRTPEIVRSLATRLPNIRVVTEQKEGMMGWDLRKGLDSAKGEIIGMIDGDGQFPVETVFSCLAKMMLDNVDLVKTYRVVRFDGLYRLLISRVYNLVFQMLFGRLFKDVNSKPKLFKRAAYKKMALESDDWFIDAEIMIKAKLLNLKVAELPVAFYAQKERSSFVKVSAILEFVRNLFKSFKRYELGGRSSYAESGTPASSTKRDL